MYIDDFIWLPDIVDKLAVNITCHKMKWKRYFSINPDFDLLNLVIIPVKMFMLHSVKLMQVVT